MTFMDRIANFFRSATPVGAFDTRDAWGATPIAFQVGKPVWPKRSVLTYTTRYDTAPLIYRCVNVTANAIGSAPLRVYRDNGGEPEEDAKHPLRQLMNRPNVAMGESRFLSFTALTTAITGFCVIEKERSNAGRVVGLWPLRSDWIRPIPRSYRQPDWEYRVPGHDPVILSAEDALVLTYADAPDGRYTGIGPVEVALRDVGILEEMSSFVKAFFDGGAMPMYGLVPDTKVARMDQAQADAVKAAWVHRYGGLRRSVEPAILQGITDVKRLGFDFNELAYTDLRDLSDVAICQAFGVSPMFVDAPIGLKHSTYSNKQEARKGFYEDTISPLWARIDDAFTFGLLPEFEGRPGYSLQFDTSGVRALQDNENETWQRTTAAVQAGYLPVNVGLRLIGEKPVAGGDVFLRSIASIEVPASPERGGQRSDVRVREVTPRALPGPSTVLHRLAPEVRDRIGVNGRHVVGQLGDRGAPLLRTFWRGQARRVIDAARRSGPPTAEQRDIAEIDWSEEERLLAEVINRLHIVAGETSFTLIGDQIGVAVDWDLANPNIARMLAYLIGRDQGPTGMTATTRADVAKIVTSALDEGVTIDDLAGRLKGLFEETYRGRSVTIARTESQVAYNSASTLGYQESGVVGAVELLDNPAHTDSYNASDGLTCAERDGLIVPLDRVQRHIEAEHPNGSLTVVPVLSKPLGAP